MKTLHHQRLQTWELLAGLLAVSLKQRFLL